MRDHSYNCSRNLFSLLQIGIKFKFTGFCSFSKSPRFDSTGLKRNLQSSFDYALTWNLWLQFTTCLQLTISPVNSNSQHLYMIVESCHFFYNSYSNMIPVYRQNSMVWEKKTGSRQKHLKLKTILIGYALLQDTRLFIFFPPHTCTGK